MAPACWKCGYDLRGLRVEDLCPECGTPVWSAPPALGTASSPSLSRDGDMALTWGLGSILLFFACLGPFAGLVAIPAIIHARRARAAARTGRYPLVRGATTGLVCAWITIALSVGYLVVLAVLAPWR